MVCFPAIAEDDETWELEGELGLEVTRRRGEALHPERQPLATLDRIRRTIHEYSFARLENIGIALELSASA